MHGKPSPEQIINASSNGLIATDTDGKIILFNRRGKEILGFGRQKVLGALVTDISLTIGLLIMKCLRTGKPETAHHCLGENENLVLNITPVRDRGEILGSVCSVIEVGDLGIFPKGFESYERLNKQWNAIFKSSSDGIWVCDCKGVVITMNEASENLNGVSIKDIVGKNVADLERSGLFDRAVTLEVLGTKRQVSIVQYIKRTEKQLLVTGTPAFDEDGNIFLVVVNERDMTQLNDLREQLKQTRMVTEKFKDELAEISMLELRRQNIFAESPAMKQVLRTSLKLARLEASNILILGESGTGKGCLAKFIHSNSKRNRKPFIQINCAALPESLLEAELFGYEKGAFTGAREQGKVGLFELAQEGTLFLDEIGDMPLPIQAKLLKYLDDHEIMRLGGVKPIRVDCTIIPATNRDLEVLTRTRAFRKDLFYRLNTFPIRIPPLCERPDDILVLTNYFLRKYSKTYGLRRRMSPKAFEALQSYPFPGNVRELKNIVKKAVVMSDKEVLDEFFLRTLNFAQKKWEETKRKDRLSLGDEVLALEGEILRSAVRRCRSTRDMARYLGVSQPSIVRKLKKHGLSISPMRS